MDVPTHEELLASINAFQERHPQIRDARLGRAATGEPGLIGRLRNGSSPTLAILNKLKAFMEACDAELQEAGDADHADIVTTAAPAASSGKVGENSGPAVLA